MGVRLTKLSRACAATGMFLALLALAYFAHARWLHVDVVLYSALGDVVAATVIATVILYLTRWFSPLSGFEKLQLSVIWLLLGYAFAISVPTVIDRSLSFYLLEKLDQRGGGIRQDAFADLFVREYMNEHHLVAVRLTEQVQSGTIEIRDGCVILTPRGQRMAAFSRAFREYFLPRKRLLMGSYSDVLTDLYRHSPPDVAYRCGAHGAEPASPSSRP